MARALVATAAAQMVVPVIAVTAGMHPPRGGADVTAIVGTLILNGMFAGLFLGSALLFRSAGRSTPPQPT